MRNENHNHWGKWIDGRFRFLGYRRLADLATLVGCSQAAMFDWLAIDMPPRSMQKGFDSALIAALQTTRTMLFREYANVAPGDAPVIDPNTSSEHSGGQRKIRRAPTEQAA